MSISFDFYGHVHKAVRRALFELTQLAGRTDFVEAAELERFDAQFSRVAAFLRDHIESERQHIYPVLVDALPRAAAELKVEHAMVIALLRDLEAAVVDLVAVGSGDELKRRGLRIYRDVARLTSRVLDYLGEEDDTFLSALREVSSDDMLEEAARTMVLSMSSERLSRDAEFLLPALSRRERRELVEEFRVEFGDLAVKLLMSAAERCLSFGEWEALQADRRKRLSGATNV